MVSDNSILASPMQMFIAELFGCETAGGFNSTNVGAGVADSKAVFRILFSQ